MCEEDFFSKIFEEILTIRQLMELIAKNKIISEIEKFASTKNRKKVWNLLDGTLSTNELASKAKISQRAVQEFLKDLKENSLILELKRGYYKRKFDYFLPEKK
ncbi:MAG: hypothetical protein ACTSQP_21500 [Promethearchaeota archaeon]